MKLTNRTPASKVPVCHFLNDHVFLKKAMQIFESRAKLIAFLLE